MLRKALASLPETLDKTYEGILCNIKKEHSRDALKILYWLCYSARPVKLEEINEVVAVEIDECPRFDSEKRFPDLHDIRTVCSSLVTLVPKASGRESIRGSDIPRSEASNGSDNANSR